MNHIEHTIIIYFIKAILKFGIPREIGHSSMKYIYFGFTKTSKLANVFSSSVLQTLSGNMVAAN